MAHPHYGYFVGWLLLLQFLAGFPRVCATSSDCVRNVWNLPVDGPALTVVIIGAVTAIHLAGIRLTLLVNDAGVIAEIAGALVITVIFLVFFSPCSERGAAYSGGQHELRNRPAGPSTRRDASRHGSAPGLGGQRLLPGGCRSGAARCSAAARLFKPKEPS